MIYDSLNKLATLNQPGPSALLRNAQMSELKEMTTLIITLFININFKINIITTNM